MPLGSALSAAGHQPAPVAVSVAVSVLQGTIHIEFAVAPMTKPQTPLFALPTALAAWVGLAFALAFLLAFAAHAQPTAPTGIPPDKGSITGVIPWSAIVETVPADGPSHFDKPAHESLGNMVKEAVRPIHDGLSQSGVVQSIREFDADLGGGNQRDSAAQRSGDDASGKPSLSGPAKSAQQIQRERAAASLMMDNLIKETAPWALGLASLFGLGYLGKIWLDYLHAKAAGPGARRRSARSRSRRSANSASSLEGAQATGTAPGSLTQDTSRSSSSRRRSGSSESSGGPTGSSGSSGSSDALGSSSASSARRRHRTHRSRL